MRLLPACTDRGSACSGWAHRFALRVWLPLDMLAGLWTADLPLFPVPEKDGIQKCIPQPLADTNRKERPFGFPVLGGEGDGRIFLRPNPAGRKKERPLGFLVLGGLDYGAYAIRPYPFGRKK